MAKTIETRGIFAPNPSRQDSKASTTSNVARSILETEAKQREAKTARLRELRLKKEAEAVPPPPKAAKPAREEARGQSSRQEGDREGLTGRSALMAVGRRLARILHLFVEVWSAARREIHQVPQRLQRAGGARVLPRFRLGEHQLRSSRNA